MSSGGNVFAQMDAQDAGAPPPAPTGNVFSDMDAQDARPPGATAGSLAKNFAIGPISNLTGLAGAIPETMETILHPVDTIVRNVKALATGQPQYDPYAPDLVTKAINSNLGPLNPDAIPQNTPAERIARGIGGGLTAAFAPEAEGLTVGKMLANAFVGASAGAVATGAAEVVPAPFKPIVGILGGLAGGLAAHGTIEGVRAGAGAVSDLAAPVMARFSDEAAKTQAGAVLANRATSPGTVLDMLNTPTIAPADAVAQANQRLTQLATASSPPGGLGSTAAGRALTPEEVTERNFLQNNIDDPDALAKAQGKRLQPEIVPGSQPTSFQLTGDAGLGELERETETKNSGLFTTRIAEQNAARIKSLQDLQQGGDPNVVAAVLRSQFDDLDATTQAHVDSLMKNAEIARTNLEASNVAQTGRLTSKAQGAAQNIGGMATPDEYGGMLRQANTEADDAAAKRESGLWTAIDPNGDLTGNMIVSKTAGNEITGAMPKTAKPLSGEENAIFDTVKALPDLAPVQDLIALRSRVSSEMRLQNSPQGDAQSLRRLTQLRGAIQDNLNNTISEKIANEAGNVSRGTLAPEDTTLAKLKEWQNEFYAKRDATASGDVGAATARAPAGGAATQAVGADGTVVPPAGGPASAAGPEGLPGNAPTFDTAGAERLAAASGATKERARTFKLGPVGQILAKAGASDLYRIPEAQTPQRFFHPGQNGFNDMQALYRSIGQDKAVPIIQDYAAMSLRRAAMREDGTLDPRKYQQWMAKHTDSLRALPPSTRAMFGTAARATSELQSATKAGAQALKDQVATAAKTISDAQRTRSLTLKNAQAGAIGRLIGAPDGDAVTRMVGGMFNKNTSVSDFKELARIAQKSPLAMDGLRQAVADHITRNFVSNADTIKGDSLQTFVKNNRASLNTVLKPEQIKAVDALISDIKRSNQTVKIPGQSNTAQDLTGLRANDKKMPPMFKLAIDALGAQLGGAAGFAAAHLLQTMREAGVNRVDELVTKAILNPPVMRDLLSRVPPQGNPQSVLSLGRALRATVTSGTVAALASQNSGR